MSVKQQRILIGPKLCPVALQCHWQIQNHLTLMKACAITIRKDRIKLSVVQNKMPASILPIHYGPLLKNRDVPLPEVMLILGRSMRQHYCKMSSIHFQQRHSGDIKCLTDCSNMIIKDNFSMSQNFILFCPQS